MPDTSLALEQAPQGLSNAFAHLFGGTPQIYQAPGRVNLIGEHTDYNDGFVMPAAIGFYTWAAATPRNDRKLVIHSEHFGERVETLLESLPAQGRHHWSDYVVGVARMLAEKGVRLPGANLMLQGNVPQGAGLSSSASLEVAVCSALLGLAGHTMDTRDVALLCQRAENEFVGARCGIMDQFVSSHGRSDHALLLDCRSLEYRLLPLRRDVRLVICNTMVRHSVAHGEYNLRRTECEAGVAALAKHLPNVRALRDMSPSDFARFSQHLSETVRRRCRHVIQENARVIGAAAALDKGDLEEFGILMRQSHQSLRDDFEVSCPELDLMVNLGSRVQGVYGSRMTGGGFGGCTVNLVREDCVNAFTTAVSAGYQNATGTKPDIYVCFAADGARQIA